MNPDEELQGGDPITEQIKRIRAAQASSDPIDEQIRRLQGAGTDPNADLHAEFKSGALQKRIAKKNAADNSLGSRVDDAGRAVVGGIRTAIGSIPFGIGDRLLAAGRSVDENTSYKDALDTQKKETGEFSANHPIAAPALKLATNFAAFRGLPGKIGGLGVRSTGAAVGGGVAAGERLTSTDHPDESMLDKALGTLEAGAFGAGVGAVAPWLISKPIPRTILGAAAGGYVGGNVAPDGHELEGIGAGMIGGGTLAANPSGVARLAGKATEKIAPAISKALSAISEATGTRGAVNKEMAGRDRLAKFFGSSVGAKPQTAEELAAAIDAGKSNASPLYKTAKQEGAVRDRVQRDVAEAPKKAASLLDRLKALAGQKALPAPGQSQVALADAQAKLTDLEDTIQRYAQAGQSDDPMVAQLVRVRDETRAGIEAMREQSAEVARRANPASEPPWYSSRPVPARNEGRIGPMHQDRQRIYPGRGRSPSQYENVADVQEAARAPGWESSTQSNARDALEAPRGGAAPLNVTQGEPHPTPRQVKLDAGNDVKVRNPEHVPSGPQQGPQPNPLYQSEREKELSQAALAHPHVQAQMKSMLNDNPNLRGQDPSSYPVMLRLFQHINAEKSKLIKSGNNAGEYWNSLQGGLHDLREALVAKAPTLSDANRVFQLEVGATREAVERGYSVPGARPTAKGLLTKTPSGVRDWARESTDDKLNAVRGEGVKRGALGKIADQMARVPLNKGRAGILEGIPSLQASGAANDELALALGERLPEFNKALAEVGKDVARGGKKARLYLPGVKGHVAAEIANRQIPVMESPMAIDIMAKIKANPAKYQDILKQYGKGKSLLDYLNNLLAGQAGSAIGR